MIESGEPDPGGHAKAAKEAPSLPDAPLFALLRTVAEQVGVDRMDRVWIFPPRRLQSGETAVVVVAAHPDDHGDRRRVYAAHYTASADLDPPRLALDEYGTAPAERVGRIVEDVVGRLEDEPSAPPRSIRIGRDPARWDELLHELAEQHLADTVRDRRFGR